MKKYLPRIVDSILKNKLEYMGAVVIEGPKWCGKSTTAKQFSKSVIELQDPDKKIQYDNISETKPSLFLEGEKPRLFDEWQMYPVIWDSIRTDVDRTGEKGQYILTGSAKPVENGIMHTGTGRISKLLMRTMSLYESGDSNGLVSLKDIIDGKEVSGVSNLELEDIINVMVRGGWPESLNISGDNKFKVSKEYVQSLINEEIRTVDGVERDKIKMESLLKSVSRNVSTSTNKKTIINDISTIFKEEISRPTVDDYLTTLEKLFVLEYVPATNLNLRSSIQLRTNPKIELVDPSIVIASLGLKKEDLINDLNFTGFIFENMCYRDLKIYADSLGAELFYYRDNKDFEIDFILRCEDGKWGAVEVKLGAKQVEEAATNLKKFKEKVDVKKSGEPSFLLVLSGAGLSYVREDGVYVVSIGNLKN